jgi:hypothetical protein
MTGNGSPWLVSHTQSASESENIKSIIVKTTIILYHTYTHIMQKKAQNPLELGHLALVKMFDT